MCNAESLLRIAVLVPLGQRQALLEQGRVSQVPSKPAVQIAWIERAEELVASVKSISTRRPGRSLPQRGYALKARGGLCRFATWEPKRGKFPPQRGCRLLPNLVGFTKYLTHLRLR